MKMGRSNRILAAAGLAAALSGCSALSPQTAGAAETADAADAPRAGEKEAKHVFSVGDRTFLLDGKPFLVKSGDMHYNRIPREYWEHRIRMCRALGMNTVCIYVFWNIHEQRPGAFDFSGQNDVAEFCRLAQKHGLYVILRPGPYVCSEWDMGGLPWWLLKKKGIRLRSNDPYFLERTRLYMNEVGRRLAGLQLPRGGNIILVQVENEYSAYAVDKPYMANIRDMIKGAGFTDVPFFQCDWASTVDRNGLDDTVWTLNFGAGADIDAQFARLKGLRPHTPLMCTEYWSGWFDHWGGRHETRDTGVLVNGLKHMLDNNISFSLYMAHGGTTWGRWAGGNCPPFAPTCSSYDWDAPISESGLATPKFHAIRSLLLGRAAPGEKIPGPPPPLPSMELPEIAFNETAPLFDALPAPRASEDPRPMEEFDQGWGSILYRASLPAPVSAGTFLALGEVHDWAQVFADGRLLKRLDRRHGQRSFALPALPAGTRLDILVEAMGRVNFGAAIHDRKGLSGRVELIGERDGRRALKNWQVYCLPADAAFAASRPYRPGGKQNGPAFYRAAFDLDAPADTFLDMREWGKGLAWVNGHELGRFWKIGPQQSLFLPGCWLKKGRNEILVLDLLGPERAAVKGLKTAVYLSRPDRPPTRRKPGETLRLDRERPAAEGALKPGNGWQDVRFPRPAAGRYFCLEALDSQSGKGDFAIAELYVLDQNGERLSRLPWRVVYADSESVKGENCGADNLFDLQESTCWKAERKHGYPHQVVIDLGSVRTVTGFSILPRMEKNAPGMPKNYRAFVKEAPFATR